MDFKSLANIESSFKRIRLFMLVFCVMCGVITCYGLWSSYSFAEAQREKIYVLDQGKSLILALSQDMQQNRPVEAKEHVKRFHELFFTLSPNRNAIESNIERALCLTDKSAYLYYQDLTEKGYYNRIVTTNMSQLIEMKTLDCDFDTYPYTVKVTAVQTIIRESNITERSLITTCKLINSVRSDTNPHGFIMEDFEVVENKDIRAYVR